jgi:hypothetical protein
MSPAFALSVLCVDTPCFDILCLGVVGFDEKLRTHLNEVRGAGATFIKDDVAGFKEAARGVMDKDGKPCDFERAPGTCTLTI